MRLFKRHKDKNLIIQDNGVGKDKNLIIQDNGVGNVIVVPDTSKFVSTKIIINASNCRIFIKNVRYIRYTNIIIYNGDNQTVIIDDNVSIEGASFYCCAKYSEVHIHKECMLAAGIQIWTGDGHSIFDKNSNKILNKIKNKVIIREHVWVAQDVKLLKAAKIPANSIVGANAVVAGSFKTENVVIVGNPAKIIKTNVTWNRQDPWQEE